MKFTRRDTLVLAAAASLSSYAGLGGIAVAQEGATIDQAKLATVAVPDHVLGAADAPVTLIEYASPTCPHCATFSNTVYPQFKTEYIDTGKVKFVLRPFVRNVLDAVVFMLAAAAGEAKYHEVIETYFRTQNTWGISETPRDAILAIALQLGFTAESFDAALTNQELFNAMETMRDQALNEFGLTGTPTFYLNGKTLSGEQTMDELRAAIDPLVPAGFQPKAPEAAAPSTETPAATPTEPAAPAAEAPAADPAAAAPADAAPATPESGAMSPVN